MNSYYDLERKLDRLLKQPNNPRLYNDIGVMLFNFNDLQNAQMYVTKAYELDKNDKDILYNYAMLLYYQFEWKKSVPIFKSYLKLAPSDKEVIEKLRDINYQIGEYKTSKDYINKLEKIREECGSL